MKLNGASAGPGGPKSSPDGAGALIGAGPVANKDPPAGAGAGAP
jgi:hypothetical protein